MNDPSSILADEELARETGFLELVPRNCTLRGYDHIEVPPFSVGGSIVAYASPDSTYAVTKPLLASARKSILIGIYDFTSEPVQRLLLEAMKERGVRVALMLDLDHRTGEDAVFDALCKAGCDGVSAPSCANDNPNARHFRSSHEKVIVIDDEWTLVQSGNYSEASIPPNEADGLAGSAFVPGNRDMGVAVRDTALAAFFTRVLRSDMELVREAPVDELPPPPAPPAVDFFEARPPEPPTLFPSRRFDGAGIRVTPVLTPDNYMTVVPALLERARESILIEQQYVRGSQSNVRRLLDAISVARRRNPGLDVRIIVAAPMGAKALDAESKNFELLRNDFDLQLGRNLRILNPRQFVHCHNKLIVVDKKEVLVSSQNWSNAAVAENREAGLLLPMQAVASYFAGIFEADWSGAVEKLISKPLPRSGEELPPRPGDIPSNPGDYDEV
jgi:phosphatidylserine/phosphatidylglycerophosphate/cardiolipin synthase-like enzyme